MCSNIPAEVELLFSGVRVTLEQRLALKLASVQRLKLLTNANVCSIIIRRKYMQAYRSTPLQFQWLPDGEKYKYFILKCA